MFCLCWKPAPCNWAPAWSWKQLCKFQRLQPLLTVLQSTTCWPHLPATEMQHGPLHTSVTCTGDPGPRAETRHHQPARLGPTTIYAIYSHPSKMLLHPDVGSPAAMSSEVVNTSNTSNYFVNMVFCPGGGGSTKIPPNMKVDKFLEVRR